MPWFESVDGVQAGSPPSSLSPTPLTQVYRHRVRASVVMLTKHTEPRRGLWKTDRNCKPISFKGRGWRRKIRSKEQVLASEWLKKRGLLLQQLWLCLPSLPHTGEWLSLPTWKVPRLPQQKGRGGLLCSIALSEERRTFKRSSKG